MQELITIDVQKLVKEYNGQLYANTFSNLDKILKFFKNINYQTTKLNSGKKELNFTIVIECFQFIIKTFPKEHSEILPNISRREESNSMQNIYEHR